MSSSGRGDGTEDGPAPGQRKWTPAEDDEQFSRRDDGVGGAACGESFRYQGMTDDKKRIICQARFLLESYVMDSAQRDHMSPDDTRILQTAVQEEEQEEGELTPADQDQLRDVALAFRKIGDEVNDKITKNKKINNLINSVPVGSEEEIFRKVCEQVIDDGELNWGRIVVLFYFAYKLIAKAVSTTKDCVTWIKKIIKMCVTFFANSFVSWVIQRGGWKMIKEYWGTSRGTFIALVVASVATGLYYFFK